MATVVDKLETYLADSESFLKKIVDEKVVPLLRELVKDEEAVQEAKTSIQHFDQVWEAHLNGQQRYKKMEWHTSFVSDLYMKRYY
tara:strand:+ start:479 stop:733 length:255 start_codon:yes stop_codon:yes gene_type:complete